MTPEESTSKCCRVLAVVTVLLRVCSALKKEIEQIEKGELLESELPAMWEKVQT